jgi:hypothetical protein
MDIGIYLVFHKAIFEHLYDEVEEEDKKCITLYGVNKEVDTSMNIIYEKSLPIYHPVLQHLVYNEGTSFYHIYKNGLYKGLDYIGFGQYDMKLFKHTLPNIRNILQKDKNPIIVMDFFPDIKETGFLGCHNLIRTHLNNLECALTNYNRTFNTHFTLMDVIQNRLLMCNTFVISSALFEIMMSWLIQYFREDVNVNRHPLIGNAGEIPEALIGMFLSLEVCKGAKYYKFDIEHVWPLYKRMANSME